MKRRGLLCCLMLFVVVLVACSSEPRTLTGDEREAVLEYSDPLTDNLLAGLTTGDYATFSEHFSEALLSAIPESAFLELEALLLDRVGAYIAREVVSVQQTQGMVAVIYRAEFTLDDPVTIRVVFEATEPHRIVGLWFDSARLRAQ